MKTNEFTPKQLRQLADAKEAKERGEPVEWRPAEYVTQWLRCDIKIHGGFLEGNLYRPAPAPAPRYWSEPAHVPGPVCWLRATGGKNPFMVLGFGHDGIQYAGVALGILTLPWPALEGYKHSTDRKEWKACLVQP